MTDAVPAGTPATAIDVSRPGVRSDPERTSLLIEATSDLALSLDLESSLKRLARLVVPVLADWVVVDLAGEDGRPKHVAMYHRDGMPEAVWRFASIHASRITDQSPQMRILRGSDPILSAHAETRNARAYVTDTELLDLCDELGICSAMYVPLAARDRVLGCLTLVSGRSGRIFDEEDLDFAADLARRAALVVDNTTLYEREHHIAHLLQQSLLPKLPTIEGLDIAARYLPSDRSAEVGGDFYDVMVLPGATVGVAVGDVVGHDLEAAAVMGQLRVLLRATAWESTHVGGDPALVVAALDRLVQALELTPFATLFYARADRRTEDDQAWSLTYCSAGHPAALLRLPSGEILDLDRARSAALGVLDSADRTSATVAMPAGSVFIAFTDGLVERRHESSENALRRVRAAISDLPSDATANAMAEAVVSTVGAEHADDIALLVVRCGAP
jgi:serine phosphatase RsbU (regulator of sigma subunit)